MFFSKAALVSTLALASFLAMGQASAADNPVPESKTPTQQFRKAPKIKSAPQVQRRSFHPKRFQPGPQARNNCRCFGPQARRNFSQKDRRFFDGKRPPRSKRFFRSV